MTVINNNYGASRKISIGVTCGEKEGERKEKEGKRAEKRGKGGEGKGGGSL